MIKGLSTRDLLRGKHSLAIVQRRSQRRLKVWALLLALVAGGALLYWAAQHQGLQQRRLSALEQENAALKAQLELVEMSKLEVAATYSQLERRNVELTGQVRQLKTDLAFFRQQKR